MSLRRWWVVGALALGMCSGAADEGYVERVLQERAAQDARTRDGETTPFTPVDMRMIPVDERIVVAVCGGEPAFDPAEDCEPRVTLRYTAEGFRIEGPEGERDAGDVVPLGRFRLGLSRQDDRGRILVHDPEAPGQRSFSGYAWFPPDPRYRFVVQVEPYDEPRPVRMATTAGLFKTFLRYGRVRFRIGGQERSLTVYLPEGGDPSDPSSFFIPFRDATAGSETYAVGRYAGLQVDAQGRWILDFNGAGSPNCAYNPHWNCPVPPQENVLDVPIPAGEKLYGGGPAH